MIRRHHPDFTWEGVHIHPYKEDGTHFKSITRQTVFQGDDDFPVECRYFEILENGHSTLERHQHQHLVMVIRGRGQVLVGEKVSDIEPNDVVHVPARTWHQFRASKGETLGFWCVVRADRDKPERPDSVEMLGEGTEASEFVRL